MPSTSIARTVYDEKRQVLAVWFVASGLRYDYEGVPPEIYQDFRRAFSKGRYFNAMIRDSYPYQLVDHNRNQRRAG